MALVQWTLSTLPEAGKHYATVSSVTEIEGQYGPQVQLEFEVLDIDGNPTGLTIKAWASAKLSPKSKLYEWASILLGEDMPRPGEPLDTSLLVGRECYIKVVSTAGQKGEPRVKVEALEEAIPF